MRIYTDMDLVAAESLRAGLWDDLDALRARGGALGAGLRGPPPRRRVRAPGARRRGSSRCWARWSRSGAQLDALERDHKLDFLREPDLGFAWAAYRWAEGDDLDEVLDGTDLAAGDFVRWMKQLLDLAGQVADAAGDTPLRATARETVGAAQARGGGLLGADASEPRAVSVPRGRR